jgi:hypothetical protein
MSTSEPSAAFRHATDSRGRALYDSEGKPILEAVPLAAHRPWGRRIARTLGCFGIVIFALFALLIVIALIERAGDSSDGANSKSYPLTWKTSLSSTSCSQWVGTMTETQRVGAAAALITAQRKARATVPSDRYLPTDAVIRGYETAVTNSCRISGSGSVAAVASAVFSLDPVYAQ